MNFSTLKHPSAFVPLAMSLAALAMVIMHALVFGRDHETDEGTPAHIFQLFLVAQLPIVAFFAIKWLPQDPAPALAVLALQASAGLAAIVSVLLLT